jgi:hypothetical protein
MDRFLGAFVRVSNERRGQYLFVAVLQGKLPTIGVLFTTGQTNDFIMKYRDCFTDGDVDNILGEAVMANDGLPSESTESAIIISGYVAGSIWDRRADFWETFEGRMLWPQDWDSRPPRATTFLTLPRATFQNKNMIAPLDVLVGVMDADRNYRAWVCYDAASVRQILDAQQVAVGVRMPVHLKQLGEALLPEQQPGMMTIEIGNSPASARFAEDLANWCEFASRTQGAVFSPASPTLKGFN